MKTTMVCKGCGGEYDRVQAEDAAYFHVCPDSVAQADRRNENIKSTAAADSGIVKAPGKGADPK